MTRMPFFAQPKFFSRLLVERPNMPLRPCIRHARLPETHVGAQSAQEQIALLARQQPLAPRGGRSARNPRHRAEWAPKRSSRRSGKTPCRRSACTTAASRLTRYAVYHVEPLAPFRDELGDELRRILQITVHQHHRILRRDLHAAAKRRLRAEIARMRDAEDRADSMRSSARITSSESSGLPSLTKMIS